MINVFATEEIISKERLEKACVKALDDLYSQPVDTASLRESIREQFDITNDGKIIVNRLG